MATRAQRVVAGAISAMLCWLVLGLLGANVAEQPLPSDHILLLADEHRIDLHSPLRWHGHLRDEPDLLPWGVGYDIDVNGVEAAGPLVPALSRCRVLWPAPGHAKRYGKRNRQMMNSTANSSKNPTMARYS